MMEMRYDLHAIDFKLVLHIRFQSMLYEAKSHSDSIGYQSSTSLLICRSSRVILYASRQCFPGARLQAIHLFSRPLFIIPSSKNAQAYD